MAAASDTGGPSDAGRRLASAERRLRLYLVYLAGRAVRERVELDDLVQEVYLRALASPRGLPLPEPGEGPLWGVLSRLAREVVIDVARALRAKKRAGRTEPLARSDWSRTGAALRLAASGPGPATALLGGEARRTLAECYLALAPEHRRVIGLRQFQGLSARDSAARIGRTETALHSLYRRALAAWQAVLEKNGISPDESAAGLRPDPP